LTEQLQEGRMMSEMAALDAVRASADSVSRLIEQHLPVEGGRDNVQDIVRYAHFLWRLIRDKWEQFKLHLDQGLEAGRARQAAASAALACDSLLRVVAQLQAAAPAEATGDLGGLPELAAAVDQAREIQKAARSLVDLLDAPAPPIDEARLAEGLAALQRGDFEDTAAIVARLKSGGDL
jgi:hypothetical protein